MALSDIPSKVLEAVPSEIRSPDWRTPKRAISAAIARAKVLAVVVKL